MKIKKPSKRNLLRAKQRAAKAHWWLLAEKVKKTGRLKQLNKHNSRLPSEFIQLMKERYEAYS